MSISQPIFTNKNISKDIWDEDTNNLQDRRKMLWQFFIFMDLEILP